jgi:hypothetical protein
MDLPSIRTSLAILLTLVSIGLFFNPYWHTHPTTPRISSGTLVCTHQVVAPHWSSFGSGFATHNLYHAHTWIFILHASSSVVRLVHFVYFRGTLHRGKVCSFPISFFGRLGHVFFTRSKNQYFSDSIHLEAGNFIFS